MPSVSFCGGCAWRVFLNSSAAPVTWTPRGARVRLPFNKLFAMGSDVRKGLTFEYVPKTRQHQQTYKSRQQANPLVSELYGIACR